MINLFYNKLNIQFSELTKKLPKGMMAELKFEWCGGQSQAGIRIRYKDQSLVVLCRMWFPNQKSPAVEYTVPAHCYGGSAIFRSWKSAKMGLITSVIAELAERKNKKVK